MILLRFSLPHPARLVCLLAVLTLISGSLPSAHADEAPVSRPNVLVILADDLGFSDLGCYGGQIETPHLDKLAARGQRWSQFYNTARCWPSRAALMTGLYPHQARMAMNYGPDSPPAYSGIIPRSTPMISELLSDAGYRCYHSGKWHLTGRAPQPKKANPLGRGFNHTYLVNGHDNFFFPTNCFVDETRIDDYPDDFYLTDEITRQILTRLQDHARDHANKPFFGYLAYTAPHFPLHAKAEDIAYYADRYKEGWDVARQKRLDQLKANGLLDCDLSPRDPEAVAWDSLSAEEQTIWATRMAIHAAMVTSMDRGIGQVLAQIEAMNATDNTLVLFLSDNGASAEYLVRGEGDAPDAAPGSRKSFKCLEIGWANAANAPLRMSKIWVHEGGVSTPLIASWPNAIKDHGTVRHDVGHLVDLLPTVIEAAGVAYPETYADGATPQLAGQSLITALKGGEAVPPRTLFFEHQGNRGLRVGDWKIVAEFKGPWELYNLANDRSESHNLAETYPDLTGHLIARWEKEASQQGVVDWGTFPQSRQKPNRNYRMK